MAKYIFKAIWRDRKEAMQRAFELINKNFIKDDLGRYVGKAEDIKR